MNTIADNMGDLKKDAATGAAQVTHLTNAVAGSNGQMGVNSDFPVDAVQQARAEFSARFDYIGNVIKHRTRGGSTALSSTGKPVLNSLGEPS